MSRRGAHRAPLVRATRVLQHVAAGLATLLVVGVLGVIGARVSVPDGPAPRVGSSPTRTFPDQPVPAPVTSGPSSVPAPPAAAVVAPELAPAPRPVVTQPP